MAISESDLMFDESNRFEQGGSTHLDKVKAAIERIPPVPGGSTPAQYGLPPGAEDLQDLIEHRKMNFSVGNIFKGAYRLGHCDHSDPLRDLNKIIWFANREKARILKEKP